MDIHALAVIGIAFVLGWATSRIVSSWTRTRTLDLPHMPPGPDGGDLGDIDDIDDIDDGNTPPLAR